VPPIIEVKGVSKRFSRNANAHLSYGLTDLMREVFARGGERPLRADEFYAVDDVSLALEPGDSFALIGRNGSGKTTLLKMLNGLIKPDRGEIRMNGSVQALINLGTGFNPNLSGRDNVFNAASLVGLSRSATENLFDEIVDFSELAEFIDSPFRSYSSGMKARLGFAVAVHLHPEILLIDEILAVGDYAFQNKCFARMQLLKKSGVTFVLVSHSHTQIIQLCDKALWMHQGKAMLAGGSKEVVEAYLKFLDDQEADRMVAAPGAHKKKSDSEAEETLYGPRYHEENRVSDIMLEMLHDGQATNLVPVHSAVLLRYRFHLHKPVDNLNVTLNFHREDGLLISVITTLRGDLLRGTRDGDIACEINIPDLNFVPGNYVITMPIHEGHGYLFRGVVHRFRVTTPGEMYWGLTDLRYTFKNIGEQKD